MAALAISLRLFSKSHEATVPIWQIVENDCCQKRFFIFQMPHYFDCCAPSRSNTNSLIMSLCDYWIMYYKSIAWKLHVTTLKWKCSPHTVFMFFLSCKANFVAVNSWVLSGISNYFSFLIVQLRTMHLLSLVNGTHLKWPGILHYLPILSFLHHTNQAPENIVCWQRTALLALLETEKVLRHPR